VERPGFILSMMEKQFCPVGQDGILRGVGNPAVLFAGPAPGSFLPHGSPVAHVVSVDGVSQE